MSNLSTKNDQAKAKFAKSASLSSGDKKPVDEGGGKEILKEMKEGAEKKMEEGIEESEGLNAEEKLIAQVAAEAQKTAKVDGATKQENATRKREESQDEILSFDGSTLGKEDRDTTQEQIADLSERLARALAEVENTRRRFQREKQDALRYGASQLAMDVFEVADNLQRARAFVSDEAMEKDASLKNLVLGIRMTEKSLEEALKRNQVVTIVPKVGEPFSAEHHQAVSQIENDELADGSVVELLQCGYRMGDRLLRAAQVITAKSKSKNDEKADASSNDALAPEEVESTSVAQDKPTTTQDEEQ